MLPFWMPSMDWCVHGFLAFSRWQISCRKLCPPIWMEYCAKVEFNLKNYLQVKSHFTKITAKSKRAQTNRSLIRRQTLSAVSENWLIITHKIGTQNDGQRKKKYPKIHNKISYKPAWKSATSINHTFLCNDNNNLTCKFNSIQTVLNLLKMWFWFVFRFSRFSLRFEGGKKKAWQKFPDTPSTITNTRAKEFRLLIICLWLMHHRKRSQMAF